MGYDFNEHKHRYAVWTAARAVQRSFTTTEIIKKAIESSSLRQFSESSEKIDRDRFDQFQIEWCDSIIKSFEKNNITCSYGRAAKIVAVYLKTAVILPGLGNSVNAMVIHPPIDRILLTRISKEEEFKDLKKTNWTSLKIEDYWHLVGRLKKHQLGFNWKLEQLWKPEKETKQVE